MASPPAPPRAPLKSEAFVAPFFCICSLKASASSSTLLATRKSAPPSATNGFAKFAAFSMSPSHSRTMSAVSASSFLATNFCSRSLAIFLALVSSACTVPMWAWSFFSCSSWPAWPLTSRWRSARKCRASSILACAARSKAASFSQISVAVSAERVSRSSVARGAAACVVFSTSASTAASFSDASCMSVVRFRPSVSRRNWLSFCPAALMRSVSFWNSSVVGFEVASP
mmetsp:Transcript_12478/g.39035  ORF Transcript_12478/g.39035 Transcript_12478/m.39035 type:complete len:228 (+) Transcript_12478:2583-3266(+)